MILKIEIVLLCGDAGDVGLQKNMGFRLGDEGEDGKHGPSQDAGLLARENGNDVAPSVEFGFKSAVAVEIVVQADGEGAGSGGRFQSITDGHFFEREKQVGAGFNFESVGGDFGELFLLNESAKVGEAQKFIPLQVGVPFVITFPGEVGVVGESTGEEAEELSPAANDSGRLEGLKRGR